MSAKFTVATIFKAKDQTSPAFKAMSKNAKLFGDQSARSFKKAGKSATSFGSITKGILTAGAITKSLSLVKQGLAEVTTEFIAFDDAITASSAKFKGLDLSTKEGQKTLESLKKTAREVGATTKFSATEGAQGLDFYATAGFNAQQSMAVLAPTAKLATVANLDLARTSDIASDSLGAFGLMTKDSVQLQNNFSLMSDQMSKTMTSSNVTMETMFETIKNGAPSFIQAGQEMSTFNALMGTMAGEGLKGQKSGIVIKNMMLRLAKATPEAQKALSALGVTVADQNGKFRDVFDILGDMENGMKGLGNQQKAAALKTIFGTEAITGINIVLKKGVDGLRKYRKEIEDSKDATDKMAAIMGGSLKAKLAGLRSAAIEVGFKIFDAFGDTGARAIDIFTEAVRKINVQPLVNGIKFIAGATRTAINAFVEIGTKSGMFDKIREAVKKMEPAFNTVVDIIKTLFKFGVETGIFDLMAASIGALADVVGFVATVFTEMWKVVKPIIEGITAFVKLFKEFKGLSGKLTTAGAEQQQQAQQSGQLFTRGGRVAPERQPPNKVQVESRQTLGFRGRLDIAGAPEGSTVSTDESTAPAIDVRMLGRGR